MIRFLLGSQSPRRKEILGFFSLPFSQQSPDFDEESVLFQGDPADYAEEIAHQKMLCLQKRFPSHSILTADTVVFLAPHVYLKPKTLLEAKTMLQKLQGKDHEVWTAVCLWHEGKVFQKTEMTRVFLEELTDDQIDAYHRKISPFDKAAGYAIQKEGCLIVKRIEGCYYNVMGLPIQTVRALLLQAGIDLWDYFSF